MKLFLWIVSLVFAGESPIVNGKGMEIVGTSKAYQERAGGPLSVEILGGPAELLYNTYRYGKPFPKFVTPKTPERVKHGNTYCAWAPELGKRGEYRCVMVVDSP